MATLAAVLPLVMPLTIWAVLVWFGLALCLAIHDGWGRLRRLHQIPCHRCAFYTGSPYLKCPVHPHAALSELALGCRDYEPVNQTPYPRTSPVQACAHAVRPRHLGKVWGHHLRQVGR